MKVIIYGIPTGYGTVYHNLFYYNLFHYWSTPSEALQTNQTMYTLCNGHKVFIVNACLILVNLQVPRRDVIEEDYYISDSTASYQTEVGDYSDHSAHTEGSPDRHSRSSSSEEEYSISENSESPTGSVFEGFEQDSEFDRTPYMVEKQGLASGAEEDVGPFCTLFADDKISFTQNLAGKNSVYLHLMGRTFGPVVKLDSHDRAFMFTNLEIKPLLKDIFPHCTFMAPDSTTQPLDFKTSASILHNYFEPRKEQLGVKCDVTQKGGNITLLNGCSITPSIKRCADKVQDREGKLANYKLVPFKTLDNKDFHLSFSSEDRVGEFLQAPKIDVDSLVNPDGPSIFNLLYPQCQQHYFDRDTNSRAQARKANDLLSALDVTSKIFEESMAALSEKLPDIRTDPGIKTLRTMLQVTHAMANRAARAKIEEALSSRLLLRQKAFRYNMQHHYERILKADLLSEHIAPMKDLKTAAKSYFDSEPSRRDYKPPAKGTSKSYFVPDHQKRSHSAKGANKSEAPMRGRGRSFQSFRRGQTHGRTEHTNKHYSKKGYDYKRGSRGRGYNSKNQPSHSTAEAPKADKQPSSNQ